MIKLVEIFLLGSPAGKKTTISFFCGSSHFFCQSPPTNSTKVAEKVYLGVFQYPTTFQTKILTGKVYSWRKSKYSPGGLASFWFILAHNCRTPWASWLIKVSKASDLLLDQGYSNGGRWSESGPLDGDGRTSSASQRCILYPEFLSQTLALLAVLLKQWSPKPGPRAS